MTSLLIQLADFGMGAACLVLVLSKRLPQRVSRLEKHTGLPPYMGQVESA